MNKSSVSRYAATLLFAVLLGGGLISNVRADDLSDALATLQTAVQKEIADAPKSASLDPYGRGPEMALSAVQQIRSFLDQDNYAQVEEMLNGLPQYLKSTAVLDATANLKKLVEAKRDAQQKIEADEIDAALKAAADAVHSASVPADLDKTIDSLADLTEKSQSRPYFNAGYGGNNKLRTVRQFVLSWQDYLEYKREGNLDQEKQTLQNLRNQGDLEIIPRSEILAKIAEISGAPPAQSAASTTGTSTPSQSPADIAQAILLKTKTLGQIPAAQKELADRLAQLGNTFNSPYGSAKKELDDIQQAYSNFKAGLPAEMPIRDDQAAAFFNDTLPLRLQLFRLAAPQILGVEDKPTSDESVAQYLDRELARAQQDADGALILRVRDLQDALASKTSITSTAGPLFLMSLRGAQNEEAAGQFVTAVISYQTALAVGGDLAPAQVIGMHLASIKKDHPDDYAKGMEVYLSRPAPTVQNYNTGIQPKPTITIPGAETLKPAASPAPSKTE